MSLFVKIGKLFSKEKGKTPEVEEIEELNEGVPVLETTAGEHGCESEPDDSLSSQGDAVKESAKAVEVNRPDVPLEDKEELLHKIVKMMNRFLDIAETDNGKNLVIWLDTDMLSFQAYDTENYRKRIQASLLNEYDFKLDTVSFRIGLPSEELRCTPVGHSGKAFLQMLRDVSVPHTHNRKASVSIFGNAGSLLHSPCILSADEIHQKNLPAYNIGAGEFPKVQLGYRQNHIAIDDTPDGPMFEKNKYVSRMHAHIGYSDMFGFYLQAEKDGTRRMGKRTRIFRGNQIIEMDNTQAKEPLQSGDLIELGKSVVLQYVAIEE